MTGSVRAGLALSGTEAVPVLKGEVSAPAASLGDLSVADLQVEVEASGPLRTGTARFAGTAARLGVPGLRALAVDLRGAVERAGAEVALTAAVPALGRDPVEVRARGRFGPARESLLVDELRVGWPGQRFELSARAAVRLEGPSVDRLELASGDQRIALEGGLAPDGGLDARLEVARLELDSVPPGLLPADLGLSGEVSLRARAGGRPQAPLVEGALEVARGAVRGLEGLEAAARIRWDGEASRASAEATLRDARGGTVEASLDLPLPLRRTPGGAPVAAGLKARGILLEDVLRISGATARAGGRVELAATLEGTAGDPSLRVEAGLADGSLGELDRLSLATTVEAAGGRARLQAELAREGSTLATVEVGVPLGTASLLDDPGAALRSLARAPIEATAEVPGAELASLAGMKGLPAEIEGRLAAAARLEGTLAAPRGEASLEVAGGALAGYRGVGIRARATASGETVALGATATLGEDEVVRLRGSLGAPPERLLRAEGREAVTVQADLEVVRASLTGAAGPEVPLSGTVEGRASLSGTLGAPVAEARFLGAGLALAGRGLGALEVEARYRERRAAGTARLEAASGGSLAAEASLGIDLAPFAAARTPLDAPASFRARAERLDLGFLAAVAPRHVRSASGRIAIDLAGEGPLRSLRPRGTVRLDGGRVAAVDHGEWTDGALDLRLAEESVQVELAARRGTGRLEASLSARGLGGGEAPVRIEGRAAASRLTLVRGAQDVATLDGAAKVRGELAARRLEAKVEMARTTVRLPKQLPRDLQSLERRPDIVVGRARPPGRAPPKEGPVRPPSLEASARVVAQDRIEVRSEQPRASVDLVADVTFELAGGELFAEGTVEVERGEVEPISGRNFTLRHGKVQFTGGPPAAAVLDLQAEYESPQAKVTVVIGGPLTKPEIELSSDPPMDDGAIAMLIATGQAEFRPGTGGVGTLSAEEAGRAALGAVATQVFKGLVAEKLPLDSVAVDATTLRAGKYVGDRVYVSYIRRFDAKPEEGEPTDEVQLQFRVSRRWKLEATAGTAQNYGASLIWSRDY
jgi:translocation and assembly module TamB